MTLCYIYELISIRLSVSSLGEDMEGQEIWMNQVSVILPKGGGKKDTVPLALKPRHNGTRNSNSVKQKNKRKGHLWIHMSCRLQCHILRILCLLSEALLATDMPRLQSSPKTNKETSPILKENSLYSSSNLDSLCIQHIDKIAQLEWEFYHSRCWGKGFLSFRTPDGWTFV